MTNFHPTQLIKHFLLIFCMQGKFACYFSSADIFKKNFFQENHSHSVVSDLDPKCLHRLLANEKVNRRLVMKRILSQKRNLKAFRC